MNLIELLIILLLWLQINPIHDWEKISLAFANSLPAGPPLPRLGLIDSWARRGSDSRLKPYLILSGLFVLDAIILIPWYRLLRLTDDIIFKSWLGILLLILTALGAGVILVLGVAILSTVLPDYNSEIYLKAIINKLNRLLIKSEKQESQAKANEYRFLIDHIRKLEKPIVKPKFIPGKGPLTNKEMDMASKMTVWLVWYDDRFEWFESERSSFLACVWTTREDAEAKVRERPFHEEGNIGDGFEISGPYNLLEEYNTRVVNSDPVGQLFSGQTRSGPNYYLKDS